ncbi:MAG: 2-oxoacid:acceptor oxidoreductase family protein [Thermodesulfovibrionales bacterium]
MERSIVIAGSGGQGVIFTGEVLASAAMNKGLNVTLFPSYGVEKIGGTSRCTVIISDDMIGSPVTDKIDILVAMNNWGYESFYNRLHPNGLLIFDSSIVKEYTQIHGVTLVPVMASDIAIQANSKLGSNMVLLGVLGSVSGLFTRDEICKSLTQVTPLHRKDSIKLNKQLIKEGYRLYEDKKGKNK